MRPGLDLDRRAELIALDLGDHTREPVAGAACGNLLRLLLLRQEASDLGGGDDPLSARRALDGELAVVLPATERLHADAEQPCGFADPVALHAPRIDPGLPAL